MERQAFTIGMGQMRVEGADLAGNLERARAMIRRAAHAGCRAVVLPECLDTGWAHPAGRELARGIPGETSGALCAAAREAGIYVAAGITEAAGDRIYNAGLLISPEGEILVRHRKINILAEVEGLYSVGDSLTVATTELGMAAVNICADNFPNSLALGHAQARMGARLLLSPCAWAVDAGHDNASEPYGALWKGAYGTLASLYDLTVIGVSGVGWVRGGAWAGRKCIGCSLAVGPGGRVLAEGPYGVDAEALIPVEVQPRGLEARGTGIAGVLRGRGYGGP